VDEASDSAGEGERMLFGNYTGEEKCAGSTVLELLEPTQRRTGDFSQ
jgi:hypothetical protein